MNSGNSKNTAELMRELLNRFEIDKRTIDEKEVWLSIEKDILLDLMKAVKNAGFDHCSTISTTDWPEEAIFELTYHFWSYKHKIVLNVKTEIERSEPNIDSLYSIWKESSQIHERELHELFGINFIGNPNQEPLFLEDWEGPPPFRKDFNWRDHVREKYYEQEEKREKPYWN